MTDLSELQGLEVDALLFNAIVEGTSSALQMADATPHPVGCSVLAAARHEITVLVGLTGAHSGNLALNISSGALLFLASRFLGEAQAALSEENVDAVMEIGNMMAGSVKGSLSASKYGINAISLPSLVMGPSHHMLFARGIRTVSVEFELGEMPLRSLNHRFLTTSISLMQTPHSAR